MMGWGGFPVVQSRFAVKRRVEKRVRFRRHVWRGITHVDPFIIKVEVEDPAIFQMPDRIIVHPQIYQNLKSSLERDPSRSAAQRGSIL